MRLIPTRERPVGSRKREWWSLRGGRHAPLDSDSVLSHALYKRHKFLFFDRWKRNRCGPETFDRRPTFRPVGTAKFCVPKEAGR